MWFLRRSRAGAECAKLALLTAPVLLWTLALAMAAHAGHTSTECYYEVLNSKADYPMANLSRGTPLPELATQLSAFKWPDGKVADKALFYGGNLSAIVEYPDCDCIYRFKIIGGQLWRDKPGCVLTNVRRCAVNPFRTTVQEMLLLAIWAYDIPDMDIAFIGSEVHGCNTVDFPFLAFVIGYNNSNGLGVPLRNAWLHLGSSPEQLAAQRTCLGRNFTGARQIPRVFWRGRSTGYDNVFVHGSQRAVPQLNRLWGKVLAPSMTRKRVHAVFTSAPYDFMDVKLTSLDMLPGYQGWATPELLAELSAAMISQNNDTVMVPMSGWNAYAVQLSLDGYGPAFREPAQLLGRSVLYRNESPMKLWYHQLLQAGVHYEEFDYDNMNLVARSKALVKEYAAGGDRLAAMVERMNEFALQHFPLEGQLRSIVWSLLKAKSLMPWEPVLTEEFELVKQDKKIRNQWLSDEVAAKIFEDLAVNFL